MAAHLQQILIKIALNFSSLKKQKIKPPQKLLLFAVAVGELMFVSR